MFSTPNPFQNQDQRQAEDNFQQRYGHKYLVFSTIINLYVSCCSPDLTTNSKNKKHEFPRFWLLKKVTVCFNFVKMVFKVQIFWEGHKVCEIFPLLLTVCTVVKSKGKISQNFVTFSEYMNFMRIKIKIWPFTFA